MYTYAPTTGITRGLNAMTAIARQKHWGTCTIGTAESCAVVVMPSWQRFACTFVLCTLASCVVTARLLSLMMVWLICRCAQKSRARAGVVSCTTFS